MSEEMGVVRGLCEEIAADVLGVNVSEIRGVVAAQSGQIVGIDWDKLLVELALAKGEFKVMSWAASMAIALLYLARQSGDSIKG